MKNKRWLALCGFVGLLCSCSTEPSREILITDFPTGPPGTVSFAEVIYVNTDSTAPKTMDILIRLLNESSGSGHFDFVIETVSPDSLVWRDTLTAPYIIRDATETSSLTYTDIKLGYRSQTQFERMGAYRFRFSPAVPGSFDKKIIGIGIEVTSQ